MSERIIRMADKDDKNYIHALWKKTTAMPDLFLEEYFKNRFDPRKILVLESDGKPEAALHMAPHVMMLNGKRVMYYYLMGNVSQEALLEEALNTASTQCLVTVVPVQDDIILEAYGFTRTYNRNRFTFKRDDIRKYNTSRVTTAITMGQCVDAYNMFTKTFDGYQLRDETYFEELDRSLQARGGMLLGYLKPDGTLSGYMTMTVEPKICRIDEIIYLDGESLACLLAYAAGLRSTVEVYTSEMETIHPIVPNALLQKADGWMARINHEELFCYAYHLEQGLQQKGIDVFSKPKYLNQKV
ncbi:MAG: GNAT family N-acetyltransferase [Erysipelotrichaceae bacterium]|nr:GNAT family N-acetyltransferase [Erysipelotrichaceae bacterium]